MSIITSYEQYKAEMVKAVENGESVEVVIDRHIHATWMPKEFSGWAREYRAELEKNDENA